MAAFLPSNTVRLSERLTPNGRQSVKPDSTPICAPLTTDLVGRLAHPGCFKAHSKAQSLEFTTADGVVRHPVKRD
jgi:hypothetical protein